MKNKLYWAYNLPLQVWPRHENSEDESSPVVDARLVNYMPRKECCGELLLSEAIGDQSREEFFEDAARHLENLARLMRIAAKDPKATIYYHDEGMDAPADKGSAPEQPITPQGTPPEEPAAPVA